MRAMPKLNLVGDHLLAMTLVKNARVLDGNTHDKPPRLFLAWTNAGYTRSTVAK